MYGRLVANRTLLVRTSPQFLRPIPPYASLRYRPVTMPIPIPGSAQPPPRAPAHAPTNPTHRLSPTRLQADPMNVTLYRIYPAESHIHRLDLTGQRWTRLAFGAPRVWWRLDSPQMLWSGWPLSSTVPPPGGTAV